MVTIDGAPAPAAFAAWIEASHAALRLANGCRVCGSSLYHGGTHGPTCTRRAVAEALFGLLEFEVTQ